MARNYELEQTYEEPLRAFDIWMKQSGYTLTTQREYKREVLAFLASLQDKAVEAATKMDVIGFLVMKQGQAGDKTRNRTLSALRTFYISLIDFELATRNPAMEVKKSKTEKNRKSVYLEEQELIEVIGYIKGRYRSRNIAIFLLMGYCGLRVGEVHRLNLDSFKKSKGTIEVLAKGRKWNEIPLPELLIPYLTEVEASRITPYRQKEEAFFVSQKGQRLSIRQIQKIANETFAIFKKQRPELGDLKLSCHKLRHSFATMLLNKGVDIRIVKELMGHASIETTMIYTHVNDDQKKQAMLSIDIPQVG